MRLREGIGEMWAISPLSVFSFNRMGGSLLPNIVSASGVCFSFDNLYSTYDGSELSKLQALEASVRHLLGHLPPDVVFKEYVHAAKENGRRTSNPFMLGSYFLQHYSRNPATWKLERVTGETHLVTPLFDETADLIKGATRSAQGRKKVLRKVLSFYGAPYSQLEVARRSLVDEYTNEFGYAVNPGVDAYSLVDHSAMKLRNTIDESRIQFDAAEIAALVMYITHADLVIA